MSSVYFPGSESFAAAAATIQRQRDREESTSLPLAPPPLVRQTGYAGSIDGLLQRIAALEAVVAKLAADHNRIAELVDENTEYCEVSTGSDTECSDVDPDAEDDDYTSDH